MAKIPTTEHVQVNFRMPADLKARIEAAASSNARSTTAEIVAALEERYPAPVAGPLDLDALNMTEWLEHIDSAPNEAEFQRRLAEINSRLSASEKTSSLMVAVHEEDDEPRYLFVTRRTVMNRPKASAAPNFPSLHEDLTPRFSPIEELTPRKRDT